MNSNLLKSLLISILLTIVNCSAVDPEEIENIEFKIDEYNNSTYPNIYNYTNPLFNEMEDYREDVEGFIGLYAIIILIIVFAVPLIACICCCCGGWAAIKASNKKPKFDDNSTNPPVQQSQAYPPYGQTTPNTYPQPAVYPQENKPPTTNPYIAAPYPSA